MRPLCDRTSGQAQNRASSTFGGTMRQLPTPGIIRAACRARFYDALEELSQIAVDPDARNSDKIKAIHELGAFGLGSADQAAVHIHAGEGSQVIGVVRLPALNTQAGEGDDDDEIEAAGAAGARGLEAADSVKLLAEGAGADGA